MLETRANAVMQEKAASWARRDSDLTTGLPYDASAAWLGALFTHHYGYASDLVQMPVSALMRPVATAFASAA